MAIFGGRSRSLIKKLEDGQFTGPSELESLLEQFYAAEVGVEDLITLVASQDRQIRDAAAKKLTQSDDRKALPLLFDALSGKPPAVQRFLVGVISGFPGPQVLAAVMPLIEGKDDRVRRACVEILCALPIDKTIIQLRKLALHTDPGVRLRVCTKLVESPEALADQQTRTLLVRLTRDIDERVRFGVLDAMKSRPRSEVLKMFIESFRDDESERIIQLCSDVITRHCAEGQTPELLEMLIPLLSEGEKRVRDRAIALLLTFPDTPAVIRQALRYSKALAGWVWQRALESLKEFGEPLIGPISELLSDSDEDIRSSALILATSFEDPRLLQPIVGLLKDDDWWIRLTAVEMLGRIGEKRSVPHLIGCLDDEELRWSAIEALTRIGDPMALQPIAMLMKDPAREVRIEAIRACETFKDKRVLPLLEFCAQNDEALEVRQAAIAAKRVIDAGKVETLGDLMSLDDGVALGGDNLPPLAQMLKRIRELGASDLHLKAGSPPTIRKHGELGVLDGMSVTDAGQVAEMIGGILSERQQARFADELQLDFCYAVPEVGRYRGNVYQDRLGPGAVFRVIPNTIPTFTDLRIPTHLKELAHLHQGLIVLSGPASCGKTTTLSAFVNLFNETKRDHILTVEDPIEFVHPFKNCLVNQREVGKQTQTFAAALRGALREDPDVIVVGEMRDPETMKLAIEASETGHLVIGTIHTTRAPKTIDRLIQSFPPGEQGQIRMMISESLKAVVCQQLIPTKTGDGRVACFEILLGSDQLANLIRDNKTSQIPSLMQTSGAKGMRTVDMSLRELLDADMISAEQAYERAERKDDFEDRLPASYLAMVKEAQQGMGAQ